MSEVAARDASPTLVGVPIPFYESPPDGAVPTRRLLLITAHFPPSSAVGALRWEKMAALAVERGWGVDVVCMNPAEMPSPDPARLAQLPAHVRVFAMPLPPVKHPGRIERILRTLWNARRRSALAGETSSTSAPPSSVSSETTQGVAREAALAPWQGVLGVRRAYFSLRLGRSDAWRAASAAALAGRIVGPSHGAVVTSGPPHFVHSAGRRVARRAGVPHVIDMRDPWSLSERLAVDIGSTVFVKQTERDERRAIRGAALIVCNTELASRALRARYPDAAARIVTVMNGSDDEVLPSPAPDVGAFVLVYTGAIYFDRDPRPLFRAIGAVVRQLGLTSSELRAEFMGPIDAASPDALRAIAREAGIEAFVRYHAPGPRSAALRLAASATMLVSLPQDTETAIPSKVFEYSRFDAWLLALARPGSATALVLEGSSSDVVAPDDTERLTAVLRRRVEEYRAGGRPVAVGADGRFSRRRQATILFDRIESLVATRSSDHLGRTGSSEID